MFQIDGDYATIVERLFPRNGDGTICFGNALSIAPALPEQLMKSVEFREHLRGGMVTYLIRATDTCPGMLLELGVAGTPRDSYLPAVISQAIVAAGFTGVNLLTE